MTLRRALHISREVALSATATVGALCLLGVIASLIFGIHPLLFRSGSMAPTINTGDLAFAQSVSASSLHKGDIASVLEPDGTRVTHRVVSNTKVGSTSQLTLKGDANKVVDPQVYDVTTAERVLLVIPKAGYVVNWLSQSPGSLVLAAYLALMGLLMFRRRGNSTPPETPGEPIEETPKEAVPAAVNEAQDQPSEPSRHRRRKLFALGAVGALVLTVTVGWGQSTWAYWTGSATANGTTFTAGSWALPAPGVSCGTFTKAGTGTINWTAVSGATSYDLYYPNTTTLAANVPSTTLSQTFTVGQSGTFLVKAKGPGGEGTASQTVTYSVGNGVGNTNCTVN